MSRLRPVYCCHKAARPPKGKRRDSQGRVHIIDVLNETGQTVVTVPWCPSDHRPEPV